jgi:hypothetical protein
MDKIPLPPLSPDLSTCYQRLSSLKPTEYTHTAFHSGLEIHYSVTNQVLSMRINWIQQNAYVFEQIIALYELHSYRNWVPFCQFCRCVQENCKVPPPLPHPLPDIPHVSLAPIDLIIHIQLGLIIGISRELLIHIQSFDCLEEFDVVMLRGHSLQDDKIPSSSVRAEMKSLIAMFQMKSPSELHV